MPDLVVVPFFWEDIAAVLICVREFYIESEGFELTEKSF